MQNKNKIAEHETDSLFACVEVGKLLTSTFNLNKILEMIMQKVSQLITADNWSLLLKDKSSNTLTFEIVVGLRKEQIQGVQLSLEAGIAGFVASTGEALFLSDAKKDPRFNSKVDKLTGFETKSIICVPLKIHGKVLGVIEIVNVKNVDIFKLEELPTLSILADFAAIAIENSQLFSKIQKMSITDEYTGLLNARYLHQYLEELLNKAEEEKSSFALIFVDIDDFKQVVDTYGHLLGSQVLKEMGDIISGCLSGKDILFKYGGDEYVIILPSKTKQEAYEIVKKIMQEMRSSTCLKTETKPVKVTASFGIAVYPEDATSKKDLLLMADNLMYDIKKSTKNDIGILKTN